MRPRSSFGSTRRSDRPRGSPRGSVARSPSRGSRLAAVTSRRRLRHQPHPVLRSARRQVAFPEPRRRRPPGRRRRVAGHADRESLHARRRRGRRDRPRAQPAPLHLRRPARSLPSRSLPPRQEGARRAAHRQPRRGRRQGAGPASPPRERRIRPWQSSERAADRRQRVPARAERVRAPRRSAHSRPGEAGTARERARAPRRSSGAPTIRRRFSDVPEPAWWAMVSWA